MPELPILSGAEVVRALESLGFEISRQRGSDVILRRGAVGCVVPLHRELKRGTLGGVLRQAGVDVSTFLSAVDRSRAQMTVDWLVRRFYDELWNARNLAAAVDILHSEITFRGSLGSSLQGRDAVCDYVTMVTTALAGYRCEIERLVTDEEGAAARMRFSGRHIGTFLGHEPTGRHVAWMGAAFFTADDGLLRDVWVLGDLVTLHEQLASPT